MVNYIEADISVYLARAHLWAHGGVDGRVGGTCHSVR